MPRGRPIGSEKRRYPIWERPATDDVEVEPNAVRHGVVEDLVTRRAVAPIRPESYDEKSQTVEALISTGAPVQRRDARGPFVEKLNLSRVDVDALEGIPVLDGHRNDSSTAVVGVVVSARREGNGIVAVIRLSQADDVASQRTKIAEGVIRAVSIGYGGPRSEAVIAGVRTVTIHPAIREVSVVPIAADPLAKIRSKTMDETETVERPEAEPTEAQTRAAVRLIARGAGMTTEQADDMIDRGLSETEARAEAYDHVTERTRRTPRIRVVGSHDDPAVILRRQTDAFAFRMAGGALPDDAREFVNMTARDFAASSLERAGVSTRGLSADDIFTRAGQHTTSDFPLVVSNAMNKTALEAYKAAESPLKGLARQRTLANFKESTALRLGEMGRLMEMSESGEFTHTTRAEAGETMRLKTFGRAINVSRKLLIDDDLNLLGDTTAAFGDAAAATEADELVALLLDNPDMRDGTPVFAAGRGNIGADSAITVEALGAARQALRLRKGTDGKTLISVAPKFILCGADREMEAEQAVAAIYAATPEGVNPFTGRLSVLVEPRITDGSWYLFSDPARLASMQFAYLSSAQGVQIQRTEAWDVLGTRFRAWLDFGCGWLDWRGVQMNEGV